MTNKVKPFYIEWTDDITRKQVMEVLDKAVKAGASPVDGLAEAPTDFKYDNPLSENYGYFGVRNSETFVHDLKAIFSDSVQITIDQVDEHLGLTTKHSFEVGDPVTYHSSIANKDYEGEVIAFTHKGIVIEYSDNKLTLVSVQELLNMQPKTAKLDEFALAEALETWESNLDNVIFNENDGNCTKKLLELAIIKYIEEVEKDMEDK